MSPQINKTPKTHQTNKTIPTNKNNTPNLINRVKSNHFMLGVSEAVVLLLDRVVQYIPSKKDLLIFLYDLRDFVRRSMVEIRYALTIDDKKTHNRNVKQIETDYKARHK